MPVTDGQRPTVGETASNSRCRGRDRRVAVDVRQSGAAVRAPDETVHRRRPVTSHEIAPLTDWGSPTTASVVAPVSSACPLGRAVHTAVGADEQRHGIDEHGRAEERAGSERARQSSHESTRRRAVRALPVVPAAATSIVGPLRRRTCTLKDRTSRRCAGERRERRRLSSVRRRPLVGPRARTWSASSGSAANARCGAVPASPADGTVHGPATSGTRKRRRWERWRRAGHPPAPQSAARRRTRAPRWPDAAVGCDVLGELDPSSSETSTTTRSSTSSTTPPRRRRGSRRRRRLVVGVRRRCGGRSSVVLRVRRRWRRRRAVPRGHRRRRPARRRHVGDAAAAGTCRRRSTRSRRR